MTHAEFEIEGDVATIDIGVDGVAISFAVGGVHMFAPRHFCAAQRSLIETQQGFDRW